MNYYDIIEIAMIDLYAHTGEENYSGKAADSECEVHDDLGYE